MEAGGDAAGWSADKLGGEKVVHAASCHCVVVVSDVAGVGGCWLWWSKWNTGLGEPLGGQWLGVREPEIRLR